jgi:Kinesin motor domain
MRPSWRCRKHASRSLKNKELDDSLSNASAAIAMESKSTSSNATSKSKMSSSSSSSSSSTMSSQVRVGVRVRPITAKEQGMGSSSILDVSHSSHCIALSGRRFTYDAVFDANTSQADLYAQVSPSLLQAFLDGYNATVR